jgi:hypothetical protein
VLVNRQIIVKNTQTSHFVIPLTERIMFGNVLKIMIASGNINTVTLQHSSNIHIVVFCAVKQQSLVSGH